MEIRKSLALLAVCGCILSAGCRVDARKGDGNENVKIATPFGGMQVRTDDSAVLSGIGLPDYPGATLVKKDNDKGAADIHMSFGRFQLRVKAVSYRTQDPPEKVQAFYATALHRFGDVITCADNRPVGTPTRTAEGLTCDKDHDSRIHVNDGAVKQLELKAGSQQHQHIVAIEHEEGGTKFGLVALDLPGHISIGDKDDEPKQ